MEAKLRFAMEPGMELEMEDVMEGIEKERIKRKI